MAKCECGVEMLTGGSCKIRYIKDLNTGLFYKRIPCGDPLDTLFNKLNSSTCPDCGVGIGGYHHIGCDIERNPATGRQLLGDIVLNDCNYEYENALIDLIIKED